MFQRTASFVGVFALLATALVNAMGGAPVAALPTPGVNCQLAAAGQDGVLRYFPEAENTNDFIGFFEFETCIEALEENHPTRMETKVTGKSYGHLNKATQQREPQNVYLIEVTNEESAIPFEDKAKVVLMLSIHGNEKGGREGGFRVLEDMVRNIGMGQEEVAGHAGVTFYDLLDYTVLILLFPNSDGWVLDEPQYGGNNQCGGTPTLYCRGNGKGTDLNRQLPTMGWHRPADGTRKTLNEPEPQGYAAALINYTNVFYAADIHGMLTPADGCAYGVCSFTSDASPTGEAVYGHFILGLISAGQLTPVEMLRSTRLAAILDERLNNNPAFAEWNAVPESTSAWGGEFYQWSTVWDTIGYTDSGISGDWFLQDTGLNAPGMDFEMAYNHITFDSAYPAVAQKMNAYHIETVREISKAYLEAAVTNVETAIEAHGKSTGYLYNPLVLTSAADRPLEGWALENPWDDAWDYAHLPYQAAPVDYFREMAPFMADGDRPAVFEEIQVGQLSLDRIKNFDNFIVAGSAVKLVNTSAQHIATLKAYVEQGGNLVLTDESLQLIGNMEAFPADKIGWIGKYAGMTLLTDREHEFAKYSVKLSRQTYEPVPIGYGLGSNAPNWYLNRTAFEAAGGETVGVVPLSGSSTGGSTSGPSNPATGGPLLPNTTPGEPEGETNVGRMKFGSGTISFLGNLLPDPSQENYHPYGLESYGTTYFGNLLLYNMIGAEQVFTSPPIVLEDVGSVENAELPPPRASNDAPEEGEGGTPGFEIAVLVAAAAAAMVIQRRRKA